MRALLLISLIFSVSLANASVFEDVWWTIDDFVPINDSWDAVKDIRLRDWLFLLLLFPVSLWAAKQAGLGKIAARILSEPKRRREEAERRREEEFKREALTGKWGPIQKARALGEPITAAIIAENDRHLQEKHPEMWAKVQEIINRSR